MPSGKVEQVRGTPILQQLRPAWRGQSGDIQGKSPAFSLTFANFFLDALGILFAVAISHADLAATGGDDLSRQFSQTARSAYDQGLQVLEFTTGYFFRHFGISRLLEGRRAEKSGKAAARAITFHVQLNDGKTFGGA